MISGPQTERRIRARHGLRLVPIMVFALRLLAPAASARGQALPAAEASPISTGFSIPTIGGSLRWAVSASQSIDWGYYSNNGLGAGTNLSADLAYVSQSTYRPFSAILSGGKSWGTGGVPSYQFASLALSQAFNIKRWNFVFSDAVGYLPSTAVGGISGVPGQGDLGLSPVQVGPDSGQGILTNYSPQVTNTAGASVMRQITGRTSLSASGSYGLLRFVDGAGSDAGYGAEDDSITGSAGFNHRLNARTSYGANFAYTSYIFLMNSSLGIPAPDFTSQIASFTYSHQFTRKLGTSLAAGPEWTQINNGTSVGTTAYADGSLDYSTEFAHMGLFYVRSTNNGWGVVAGTLSDSVGFVASRILGRVWQASANVGWSHSANLPNAGVAQYDFQTEVGGVQMARALGRNFSGYLSYMAQHQSQSSAGPTIDLFSGTNQVLSVGVTYSPVARRVGR